MEAAKATLSAQQLRLKQTLVTAPDHGVISARSATVGAVLPAGTELFRMVRQGRLEWRAEVTSSELGQIRTGTSASVTAASGATLKGRVRVIGPTVDPQSRAALVYVDLPQHAEVKAGMFGKGVFELGSSQALTVPQQAVVIRDGFSYVLRVSPDLRVALVKVQTGRRLGTQVEVLDGIKPEDDLVVQGAGFLNDGDLVKVAPMLAPSVAAPAKK
jgi:RND family efflux transporter MFP subunit